jgi:hypothetical protein
MFLSLRASPTTMTQSPVTKKSSHTGLSFRASITKLPCLEFISYELE